MRDRLGEVGRANVLKDKKFVFRWAGRMNVYEKYSPLASAAVKNS